MRFIHISDLHLGKRVNGFSMLDDQKFILNSILDIIDNKKPDAIIIAGDIYDKPVPPAEAVSVLDNFLAALSKKRLEVFMISGNHDSAERIAFGGRLMNSCGIHISPTFTEIPSPITLKDEYGNINFYMLPFIKPPHVRAILVDEDIDSYTDTMAAVIKHMDIDKNERNILVTHQLVTGAERCDSEDISVGGTDNVDVSVFDPFDYVALGHLHRPQSAGRETIRYSGSPLKYSFSECSHTKSLTLIDMGKKGDIDISVIPLEPQTDMREIKGRYEDITLRSNYINTDRNDYIHIILTDEDDIPDAISKLRIIYPNIMKLDYDNARTRNSYTLTPSNQTEEKTPCELFADFYKHRNNKPMTNDQYEFAKALIEDIWEDNNETC